MSSQAVYTLVLPVFNEEETLLELWRQIAEVLVQLDAPSEVVFIDDGSIDRSRKILLELREQHPEIKLIFFSRNFGHQCALSAGIDHASGRAIVLMDSDLQDSPSAILDFIAKWNEGYEVVYAIRQKRKENHLKRAAFVAFYRLIRAMSGVDLPMDAGIFSLLDRKVVMALRRMPERSKYLAGLRAYTGFRQTGVVVERGARYRGQPRVTPIKLFKLAFDGIFSFSILPLRISTFLGLFFALTSFVIGLVGLYVKFVYGSQFLSWTYGLTTTFFMGGIQLVFLGVIGEYIGRIYEEVKQRPYYLIDRKIGFSDQELQEL